jgi:hypothetical protein
VSGDVLALSSRIVVRKQSEEQASPVLPGEELATQGDTLLGQTDKKTITCRMEPNNRLTLTRGAIESDSRTNDEIDAKSTLRAKNVVMARYDP